MATMRSLLLKASESPWLAARLPNYPFARKAVRRFMPGETAADALRECAALQALGIGTVITRLGENITLLDEAASVTAHYADVLADIRRRALQTHISVKLTQLGLDIDATRARVSVEALMKTAAPDPVWIDMEGSRYRDITLNLFREARATGANLGLCVQAYLRSTRADLAALPPETTAIRLVKGAYKEPAEIAFAKRREVDANYVACARTLLERARTEMVGHVPAFATHDVAIIRQIAAIAETEGIARDRFEFQLLYGINTNEQLRLARAGFRVRVLISYGPAWFAWYMRRLAERPANVLFLLKNLA
jgi:proline dehydrogenase